MAVGQEPQPAAPVLSQNGRDISAIRVAELSSQSVEAGAGPLDSYCGAYHLGLGRVLTITREGERLSAQETGRRNSRSWRAASMRLPAARMIWLFFCATVSPR